MEISFKTILLSIICSIITSLLICKKGEKNKNCLEVIIYILLFILIFSVIIIFAKVIIVDNSKVSDTNQISNIIAVSAIFFTILTVSVNLLQFTKAKEINDLIKQSSETEKKITAQFSQISDLKKSLDIITDTNNFYINELCAENEFRTTGSANPYELLSYYKNCIDIVEKYGSSSDLNINPNNISRVYVYYFEHSFQVGHFEEAEEAITKSFNYPDLPSDEIVKRIYYCIIQMKKSNFSEAISSLENIIKNYSVLGAQAIYNNIKNPKSELSLSLFITNKAFKYEVNKLLSYYNLIIQ